jgi:hypothetical protein
MPTVDFTLEDMKQLIDERLDTKLEARFVAEREYTRSLVREEVSMQFQGFIEHSFTPAIESIDDRLDALADSVAILQIDMRHVKRVLRSHHADVTALKRAASG